MVVKFVFNLYVKVVILYFCFVVYVVENVIKVDFYLYIFGIKEVYMKIYGWRGEENENDKIWKFFKRKSCVCL